ncbi:hypothetical protein QBC44DRAFT_247160 [Cladorrhinum sp. PSN332]|nr:hypothetical protein QBC44DRAFT_247160 [Cladorrhinum sp. PSN332]
MGLHRKESLLPNFPDRDPQQQTAAVCLFWCVYTLDRRWSLGTGLSFALVGRDIDPELPEPVSFHSRLPHIIDRYQQAAYNHFLVSALAIVLLAVSHAPALFAHHEACRNDFSEAIELVRGFSESSVAGRRLRKSVCGLVSAVSRLGELFDPNIYRTHAEPDMTHVGVDLMGLFDAFGQELSNDAQALESEAILQSNNPEFPTDLATFPTDGGGGGVDEMSRFFMGLI